MWDAIHKKTKKPYYAYQIWNKFEKPHNEEWYCCPICEKPVTPIKKHKRVIHNKEILIPSFFRIMAGYGGCISYESDEHKAGKIIVASLIEYHKDFIFTYRGKKIKIPSFKKVPELKYRWEQKRGERRADVLFEFTKFNAFLGKGIAIEIAISENKKSLYEKTIDWVKNRYSVIWLFSEDFSENTLKYNNIEIKYPYGLFYDIIHWSNELIWNNRKAKKEGAFGQNKTS